jgi:hypothetical protein
VTYVYYATVQSGLPRRTGTVRVSVDWACDKTGCKTISAWPHPAVGGCHALALQVGPIASYGKTNDMLTPEQLDQCNRGIPGARMVAATPAATTPAQPASSGSSGTGSGSQQGSPATTSEPAASNQPATETVPTGQAVTGTDTPAAQPATEPSTPVAQPSESDPVGQPVTQVDAPVAAPTSAPATIAETDRGVTISGIGIVVPQLGVVGGLQTAPSGDATPVSIDVPAITVVGGTQGAAPVAGSPLTIRVPELSAVGR